MRDHTGTTREALLDAAADLFSERGYQGVGIREIVDRAQANIAAIKYYFGSKSDLYVEAVRRTMERQRTSAAWEVLSGAGVAKRAAAVSLIRFIRMFLERLMEADGQNAAVCLMMREAAEPSEAIDSIVRSFVEPNQDRLIETLSVIIPDATRTELAMTAQSILGQVLHYRVFGPFLERMPDHGPWGQGRTARVAKHIARLVLRGLGLRPAQIEESLAEGLREGDDKRLEATV